MPESILYYRQREAAARASAARAADPLAARLHLEMAARYAQIVASGEDVERLLEARKPMYISSDEDGESN